MAAATTPSMNVLRDARDFQRRGGFDRARDRTDAVLLLLFERTEEEQLVLDDRAAEGDARGAVLVVAFPALTGGVVADHARGVLVDEVRRAVEVVGARLGDGVDRRAHAAARGHVVVGGGDVVFLDRVLRDRRALGRQAVVVQAEGVARVDGVDGDAVVAEVLAVGRERAAVAVGDHDAGIGAHDVLDRAVGGRHAVHVFARERRGDALVVRLDDRRARHRDGGQFLRGDRHVDLRHLVQGQVDVLLRLRAGFGLVDRDRVRAADAQAARCVTTVGVGDRLADRARFGVHDRHFGARDGLAGGIDHATADTGGRALCEHGRGSEGRDQRNRQLRQPDAISISHLGSPWMGVFRTDAVPRPHVRMRRLRPNRLGVPRPCVERSG